MKIKEGFTLKEVAGKSLIVATGEQALNFNKVIHVNHSGKIIFEALLKERTEDELVEILLKTYDAKESVIRNDVKTFLKVLKVHDIL